MQTKFILLLAFIASIKFVYGVPLLNLAGAKLPVVGDILEGGGVPVVGDIIGGNGRHVNENGILYGLNDAVGPVLGSVGIGDPNCDGILHGLDPAAGPLVNSLGLGVPCRPGGVPGVDSILGGKDPLNGLNVVGNLPLNLGGGGVPVVGDIIGGNGRHVNENGLLYGLNDALGPVLSSVGLGDPNCDGILHGLDPAAGPLVNSLGLGVPCIPRGVGNGKDDTPVNPSGLLKGFNNILKEPLCSVGLGCETCNGILEGANPTLEGPLGALGLGGCEDSGSNKKGCGCHGKEVPIKDKGQGNGCSDKENEYGEGSNGDGEGTGNRSRCNKCTKKYGTNHVSGGH